MTDTKPIIISVILCTHNPSLAFLNRTLDALSKQNVGLEESLWELIIVDNASTNPLDVDSLGLNWHNQARVVRENQLGLSFARFRGFKEARGEILLFVDDDNILEQSYIRNVIDIMYSRPDIGALGGKSIPIYEEMPPSWFGETGIDLACRDLGDEFMEATWSSTAEGDRHYPKCAPIGAGMAIRRNGFSDYADLASSDPIRSAFGRRGKSLASGEDNDLILTLLSIGWTVAYSPALVLEHLIPKGRLSLAYLTNYAEASNRTWVQVLACHKLCPWPPISKHTRVLRKAHSWLIIKPWLGPAQKIAWYGACGKIDGQAAISEVGR